MAIEYVLLIILSLVVFMQLLFHRWCDFLNHLLLVPNQFIEHFLFHFGIVIIRNNPNLPENRIVNVFLALVNQKSCLIQNFHFEND